VVDSFSVKETNQKYNDSLSEFGCKWSVTQSIILDSKYTPGYYTIHYKSNAMSSYSHFIIENRSASRIAVLAPLSTWVAYNNWGGKSLYKNYFEDPINKAESNIAEFFIKNYNAALFPDYYLESHLNLLKDYDIIVLAYHCEYFTEDMYNNLTRLVEKDNKSLLSLGGNQIYWKTKWNNDYTVMECRKDLTSFGNAMFDYGGMWRHHFGRSEHHLLGVRFTKSGMHSYAPYQVRKPNHWIFQNLKVDEQTIFGVTGVNELPLSGDETDKIVAQKHNMTLLAKGLNCNEQNNDYKSIESNCNKNAGADFVIIENKDHNILSTGAIESGAGLGLDEVFTGMIMNFIEHTLSTKK
jgi:hypothetical protein